MPCEPVSISQSPVLPPPKSKRAKMPSAIPRSSCKMTGTSDRAANAVGERLCVFDDDLMIVKIERRRDIAKSRRRDQSADSRAVEAAPNSHVRRLQMHGAQRQRENVSDRQIDAFSGKPKADVLALNDDESPAQLRREHVDAGPEVDEHRHRRRSVDRTLNFDQPAVDLRKGDGIDRKRRPRNGAGKHRCRDSCDGSLSYLTYSLGS